MVGSHSIKEQIWQQEKEAENSHPQLEIQCRERKVEVISCSWGGAIYFSLCGIIILSHLLCKCVFSAGDCWCRMYALLGVGLLFRGHLASPGSILVADLEDKCN